MENQTADVRTEILETLDRFGRLVEQRGLQVLDEFAVTDATLLVGSDAGEVARGPTELAAFFRRIFDRVETFGWQWERIDVHGVGLVAWLYAEGHVVVRGSTEVRLPYRLTAVFERIGDTWKWRHFHGAEPA